MVVIRLFCAAGMSTGILVKKMEEAAKARGLDTDIKACPQGSIAGNVDGVDVALLGPQVAYTIGKSTEICDKKGIPVGVIPMTDYGIMNGEGVLNFALKLIDEYKGEKTNE
ncbi:MAG: PTS sugar transporter subunit IIB [Coprobacillaceae bacterium]